jgi:CO/xanthine dehydrogenase FAD-binding subunit
MRNMRTISSVVLAPDWESHLLAALLVCDAALTLQSSQGRRQIALADVLSGGETVLAGELLTAVTLHTDGSIAAARVARTPADKPIVAAAARRLPDGTVRLALCGVAAQPMLVEPEQVTGLNPPGDFRGSGEYRLEMAKLLSARVLESLEAAS